MAVFRRSKPVEVPAPPAVFRITGGHSIVAASSTMLPAQRAASPADLLNARTAPAPAPGAWEAYRYEPGIRHATNVVSNLASRCRLMVADVDAGGQILGETDNLQARQLLADALGNSERAEELLKAAARALFVTGDGAVVIRLGPGRVLTGQTSFHSWSELTRGATADTYTLNTRDGSPETLTADNALVFRVWQPDGEFSWLAESPVLACARVLGRLESYRSYNNSVIASRLATAGLFVYASELTTPTAPAESDPFADELHAAFTADLSVDQQGHASAAAPITIAGPNEYLGSIRWIEAQHELTGQTIELTREARAELALALDVPTELLKDTGSDAVHWNQYATTSRLTVGHVLPLGRVFTDAFNESFYRGALKVAGLDPAAFAVTLDPAAITTGLSGDPVQTTMDAFDRGLISADAARARLGYTADEAGNGVPVDVAPVGASPGIPANTSPDKARRQPNSRGPAA